MATGLANLLLGADYTVDDPLCDTLINHIKNHWRMSGPCAALTQIQPGMIVSDSDDEKLYHYWAAECRMILQEQDNTFIVDPGGGGHYTTVQAALTANVTAGIVILVAPNAYTDTIHFTANNQTVKAMSWFNNTEITQADANIVDGGIYTGCKIIGLKINLTAPTTAKNAIQISTGSLSIINCWGRLATASAIAGLAQPHIVALTGAGTIDVKRGEYEYYHTGVCTAATSIKTAFSAGANGATLNLRKLSKITITNSGAALATAISGDIGTTGVVEMHNCQQVIVTDPNATLVIGMGYTDGGGAHYFEGNHIHVVATANTSYGLYHIGTVAIRSVHNAIHVEDTGGASYAFHVGAGATINSHFDDLRSGNGNQIVATGVLEMVSSEVDGELSIWGYITADTLPHFVTMDIDDVNDEFEMTTENNANLEGISVVLPEEYQAFRVRGATRNLALEVYPNEALGTLLNIYETAGAARFSSIQQSIAEGIATSSDLRIGLDPSLYSMILLPRAQIGADLGLVAAVHPTLYIFDSGATDYLRAYHNDVDAYIETNAGGIRFQNSIAQDMSCWESIGAGNPYFYIYGWQAGVGLKYGRFYVDGSGNFYCAAEQYLRLSGGSGIYINSTTIVIDDVILSWGTSADYQIKFNTTSNLLEGTPAGTCTGISLKLGVGIIQKLINHDDGSPVAICTVANGYVVTDVWCNVIETFDGDTVVTIGDGNDPDGFLTDAGITQGNLGFYGQIHSARGVYLFSTDELDKIYTGADTVDAFITTTTGTQGAMNVYIQISRLL